MKDSDTMSLCLPLGREPETGGPSRDHPMKEHLSMPPESPRTHIMIAGDRKGILGRLQGMALLHYVGDNDPTKNNHPGGLEVEWMERT